MKNIYFDNSATTRISEEALAKYNEISLSHYGNPSSLHALGFEAERELSRAREVILSSVAGGGFELVFTASGSEANNLAIMGRALSKSRYKNGGRIITTEGEHSSVSEPLERLSAMGFKVAKIPTQSGRLDEEALIKELTPDVILVTMMLVNNETGAVYNLPRVAKMMRARCPDAVLHVDATQAYMKIPFTMGALGADMLTLSSHKIEGPKGVGALVINSSLVSRGGISPIIFGGGQEKGLRSGTENVPAISAFAEAVRVGRQALSDRAKMTEDLRSYLIEKINAEVRLKEISLTLPEPHAPHIINLTLPGIKSETMLHYLSSRGIFVSSGSACSSNSKNASPALVAYGRSREQADSSIRVSFSHRNTKEEIDAFVTALAEGLMQLARKR